MAAVEYDSATNGALAHVTIWMNVANVTLSERSQVQKTTEDASPLM